LLLARPRHVLLLLVLILVATGLVVGPSLRSDASTGLLKAAPGYTGEPGETGDPSDVDDLHDSNPELSGRADFRVATLNLKNTLGSAAVAHDIRLVINAGDPSIIGFQERGGSKQAMLAALPAHWALKMPTNHSGSDLTPIAFDTRIWKARKSWASLLTGDTWRRARGNVAIDQYAVVALLEHRETGHVVRVASFHMPSQIHNKSTGGPNFGQLDRVHAFWRMAASVRRLAPRTRNPGLQFVAVCDCNVSETRDVTELLVRGKITKPLDLATNYSAEEAGKRRSIDYVMAQRDKNFRIVGWESIDGGLITDHPAVVATFREGKGAWHERTR